jgi:hypothetical protein
MHCHHGGEIMRGKWENASLGVKILIVAGGIVVAVGLLWLCGFIVMSLWNALMPRIFSLPVIGYWEAWGLLVLSKILFGGHGQTSHGTEWRRKNKLRAAIRTGEGQKPEDGGTGGQ